MKKDLAIFEEHGIRRFYEEKTETWFFSVVDIVQILTQQPDYQTARKYRNKLRERLNKEGSQLVTNCHRFKLAADDGKMRLTDVANAETLLRLVQSVLGIDFVQAIRDKLAHNAAKYPVSRSKGSAKKTPNSDQLFLSQ
jgi:hypothetical protein